MVLVASQGQRQLCRGQGAELCWARKPQPLTSSQVLDIFRQKTAPAFEVALKLGAIYATPANGASVAERIEELSETLQVYSEALGIAYQIRDDLSDHAAESEPSDVAALRPGLLLAIAYEKAVGQDKELIGSLWQRIVPTGVSSDKIEELFINLQADQRARTLLETYKEEAIRSLSDLENPNLKGLLRRVIGRIFNDTEIKGWCKEFEATNRRSPAAVAGISESAFAAK